MRYLLFVITLCFFPPRQAFGAEPTASLSVSLYGASVDQNRIEAKAAIRGSKNASLALFTPEAGNLRTSVTRSALDLWLLVDSSALCAKNKIDTTVGSWLAKFQRELPAESRVSLVSFRRGTFEVLASQQPLAALGSGLLRCDPAAVSAEPEKALTYVRETAAPESLQRVVWLITSGNLSLGDKNVRYFTENGVELSVFVFNPTVLAAVAPLTEKLSQQMGGIFHISSPVFNPEELPSRNVQAAADSPLEKSGRLILGARVKAADKQAVSSTLVLNLGENAKPSLLRQLLRFLLSVALVIGLIVLVGSLVRAYLPQNCADCGARQRHSDRLCGHCFARFGAYLQLENPLGAAEPAQRLIAPLTGTANRVGTRRGSIIRCLRRKGERRAVFFEIERSGEAKPTYLLRPKMPLFINGKLVTAPRYLANADEILVGRDLFRFVHSIGGTYAA